MSPNVKAGLSSFITYSFWGGLVLFSALLRLLEVSGDAVQSLLAVLDEDTVSDWLADHHILLPILAD